MPSFKPFCIVCDWFIYLLATTNNPALLILFVFQFAVPKIENDYWKSKGPQILARRRSGQIVRITDEILISNYSIIDNIHVYLFRRVKNHAAHAKHVFAQLKKEKSETELRQSIWKKLFPVLYGKAKKFIDKLFITLENKSYLQCEPLSSKVNEKVKL